MKLKTILVRRGLSSPQHAKDFYTRLSQGKRPQVTPAEVGIIHALISSLETTERALAKARTK